MIILKPQIHDFMIFALVPFIPYGFPEMINSSLPVTLTCVSEWTGLALVHAMAWCRTGDNVDLLSNGTLRNKRQWNSNRNTKLSIHDNTVCEMVSILSRGRCAMYQQDAFINETLYHWYLIKKQSSTKCRKYHIRSCVLSSFITHSSRNSFAISTAPRYAKGRLGSRTIFHNPYLSYRLPICYYFMCIVVKRKCKELILMGW